ncbi:MAG: recombinase family protein, partial [Hyphomicrobiales bacterium]|nr:recombinase family protein [Hyphomicrobiales bacterium]
MKKIRCAIYTRKSSEEGLEQEFNSLHAQREACAAYVASQKHEGWVLLPGLYDDGGISGGTLEREALQRLMHDVDEGLVDQIVVYKIDRLTRSLADFAKLVERLDAAKASFVSVTQSFNTSTSMGRLTLNVLLSFAQFEREVTAERIRDKIAASKKKGLWMGGNVPLGYEPDGRTLKIRQDEARTVRTIFDLYLEHRSIIAVMREAERIGLRRRKGATGELQPFGRGHIHYILTNPVYAGRIRHRDQIHEGQQPAIIDPAVWDNVQAMLLEGGRRKRGLGNEASNTSPLSGKLFDETGDRLTPSHANKKGRRYRYYFSSRLITGAEGRTSAGTSTRGWRLPAQAVEQQIADLVHGHLRDRLASDLLIEPTADIIAAAVRTLDGVAVAEPVAESVIGCIDKVRIGPGQIEIGLDRDAVASALELDASNISPEALTITAPFQRRKRGVEVRLVIGEQAPTSRDAVLIRSIAKAHRYYAAITQGTSFEELAEAENLTVRRILQVIELAFIAP